MRAKKRSTIRHPIIIWPEDLKNLDDFLSANFSTISYEVECVDGTTIESENLDELLEYENPSFRRLEQITVTARELLSEQDINESRDKKKFSFFDHSSEVKISLGKDKYASRYFPDFVTSQGKIDLDFLNAEQQFFIEDELGPVL